MTRRRASAPKRINLALQGGGAHGAFTWGALKRILEDPALEIAGISGTSAGALNGAAVKAGLSHAAGEDGRQTAIDNLDWLWAQVGAVNDLRLTNWMNTLFPTPSIVTQAIEYSLPYSLTDMASQFFSPYAYGPFYKNPLRRIVDRFRFDEVCADDGPAFFVNTTRVRDGKIRVFSQQEVTTDVILASACLPTVFQAIEFYDERSGRVEAFWDGGYTGNPALFPLFSRSLPEDIVIVNINPMERDEVPCTPNEIQNRVNEISFNSSLLRELRAINFVQRLLHNGALNNESMRDVKIHMIADDELMRDLSVATKLLPSPFILGRLKDAGYAATDNFLRVNRDKIGNESSVDLPSMFS
ncbi:patatin-like phospholipase family protein [Qingshengfaniella alkalisoli]|uniref:patatin-like phospholipase family protein n=1 Tax=Qingshengfaniella alkalisoli TaxID=2599296 RepID=UPI001F0F8460|nr:patatin-like phospholipase family protein [Qingshengfaniella alkalisoli]